VDWFYVFDFDVVCGFMKVVWSFLSCVVFDVYEVFYGVLLDWWVLMVVCLVVC